MKTRDDVWALPLPPITKLILMFLIDHPARVYERSEIAAALNLHRSQLEDAIRTGQVYEPKVFAQRGPDGEQLRPRHAFLPADSPVRLAGRQKMKQGQDNQKRREPNDEQRHEQPSPSPHAAADRGGPDVGA